MQEIKYFINEHKKKILLHTTKQNFIKVLIIMTIINRNLEKAYYVMHIQGCNDYVIYY